MPSSVLVNQPLLRRLFEGGVNYFTAVLSGAVLAWSPFINHKSGEQLFNSIIFNIFDSLRPKRCFKITPLLAGLQQRLFAHAHFIRWGYNSRAATINVCVRVVRHLFEGSYYLKCGIISRIYGISFYQRVSNSLCRDGMDLA